ncbi:MAG: hypothetical protein EZS28_017467 [Streblomastix strix]|uniref:Uncharacterized protein n=1 Tax=Streblomastix strix TaxID=222440 RepID=A0A5J4VXJ1_9EUKA|nr:MAG: hypothetical protein EZS28_017467 [Streblomastix strix]
MEDFLKEVTAGLSGIPASAMILCTALYASSQLAVLFTSVDYKNSLFLSFLVLRSYQPLSHYVEFRSLLTGAHCLVDTLTINGRAPFT